MLKQTNRLTKRKEFGYVYKHGKYSYNNYLTLIYVPSKFNDVRIGFSVNKKTGKAYVRNKIKRQLREIVRQNLDKFETNFNYIFVTKPEITWIDYNEIKNSVIDVLQRANKLKWEHF